MNKPAKYPIQYLITAEIQRECPSLFLPSDVGTWFTSRRVRTLREAVKATKALGESGNITRIGFGL